MCKRMPTSHRLAVSGTPIQNDLQELWSLVRRANGELYRAFVLVSDLTAVFPLSVASLKKSV